MNGNKRRGYVVGAEGANHPSKSFRAQRSLGHFPRTYKMIWVNRALYEFGNNSLNIVVEVTG